MLEIRNLHATVDGKEILKGIDLTVNAGEIHAIMGPNGSGKSTLAQVLAGHDNYEVTEGEVLFHGQNLLDLPTEERAREGIFLAFQYPVEIPGVSNAYFLRSALNEIRAHRGEPELDAMEFLDLLKEKMKIVEMDPSLMNRAINEGFSARRIPASTSMRSASSPPASICFEAPITPRLSSLITSGCSTTSRRILCTSW
jgi:Fe-S cluster assembly ATP-binding protein